MKRNILIGRTVFTAAAVVLGTSLLVFAGGSGTKLEGRLTATSEQESLASGKAKFEMRGDRIRLSVQVEDIVAAGEVAITVGGTSLGTVQINAVGQADVNLDARDGDVVPVLAAGDLVEVRDTADGTLILSGLLQEK